MHNNPVVLGVVGDSASGKTTMARGVARVLGEGHTTALCTDDYRRPNRDRAGTAGARLHPDSYYLDIVEQHLCLLRQGEPVLKPSYNAESDEIEAPEYVEPRRFIIVEGALAFTGDTMPGHYDLKVYLEPREEARIKWKIQHDKAVRGRSEREIVKELAQLNPDAEAFVKPQRRWADMVVSLYPAAGSAAGREAGEHRRMGASVILRPSLPYLDLGPVLETEAARGAMTLELDRDMGLPVDRLEVNGAMTEAQAAALEEAVWSLLPGGRRPPATADGHEGMPALRLVELLVAAYLNQLQEQVSK